MTLPCCTPGCRNLITPMNSYMLADRPGHYCRQCYDHARLKNPSNPAEELAKLNEAMMKGGLIQSAPCEDCKGTGKYVGLNTASNCKACGGSGRASVHEPRHLTATEAQYMDAAALEKIRRGMVYTNFKPTALARDLQAEQFSGPVYQISFGSLLPIVAPHGTFHP